MVAAANAFHLGLLNMRTFQFSSGFHPLNHPSRVVRVTKLGYMWYDFGRSKGSVSIIIAFVPLFRQTQQILL